MRKIRLFAVLLILAAMPSFASNAQNMAIYIEGTATIEEHQVFFMENFKMEAVGLDFTVVDNKADAGYTFRFDVEPYGSQFVIRITLVSNENDARIVSFSRFFTRLEEMYEYNQFLFFQAVLHIPRTGDAETITKAEAAIAEFETAAAEADRNDDWRNKRLYLRASINYPVAFYTLKSNGLIGGIGVYYGPFDNPERVSPLDNKIVALPGATLGLEVQLLNWLSIEYNFQLSMGDPLNNDFVNIATGMEIKFPVKLIRNFILGPYGAFSIPLRKSGVFDEFPFFAIGCGLQAGIKAGPRGAVFIDINYMHYFGDAVLKNPYGSLYPEPKGIHYRHFTVGFGIGYKFGFVDWKN